MSRAAAFLMLDDRGIIMPGTERIRYYSGAPRRMTLVILIRSSRSEFLVNAPTPDRQFGTLGRSSQRSGTVKRSC